MVRKLDITRTSRDFLADLEPKFFKQVMVKILSLSQNPTPQDSLKMHGQDGFYRVNQGEYRIVYRFDPETVFIFVIGKRNDDEVYRRMERR